MLALVVGGVGGSWLKNLPGIFMIAVGNTSYEMRLWVAIALLLVFLSLLFFVGVIIRSFLAGANRVKGWQGGRVWKKARKLTIKGMLAFVEGRWKQAENTMIKAAKNSDTKLINYLVAAQAAQHQNAEDRRDQYLRLAHQSEPGAKVAIGLTQAQLQLDNKQHEQALATLTDLRIKHANHPFILKLLCMTYRRIQDWQAIMELLPILKKHQVFNNHILLEIETQSVSHILTLKSRQGELEGLKDAWLKLPNASRKNSDNIICYTELLIYFDQMDEAESLIRPLFKKNPDNKTIKLFGDIKSPLGNKQFAFLENWYASHPQAANSIHLSLGKLAFNIALWGKAKAHLEQGIQLEANAESYFMMAQTLEQLEQFELASKFYKLGLEFVVHPEQVNQPLVLAQGVDDLVTANLLPKFEQSSKLD
ncbi:MAG: heme biosynthesis HemY N-terminal domain-containing protein [Enterobacterales bacterium]|nr:heme biosynthesis HemY N-terminal domain-containing protein [Enterobacterales bacterium]